MCSVKWEVRDVAISSLADVRLWEFPGVAYRKLRKTYDKLVESQALSCSTKNIGFNVQCGVESQRVFR
jgi:hypothetical protein